MNLSFLKQSLVIILVIISTASIKSQNNSEKDTSKCKLKLNLGTDIMSRYIWRGADYGNAPSIQPTLAVSMGNFEVGCWSAISLTNYYKEVDLYAKYTVKSFSLIITDYYVPSVNGTSNAAPDIRYFVYDDKKTAHSIEASLMYKGSKKFPLWLLGGVYIYGNDKRWGYDIKKDTTEATYYSSYLEAGYTFKFKENTADLFVGFTPTYGAYGNEMGIVNIGITGYRKIKITNDFELPLKGSLIFNPQTSNVFFALGITL